MLNSTILLLSLALTAGAQGPAGGAVDEYQLKAAFLFNFTKFVSWPDASFKTREEPVSICVLGPNPFGERLERMVAGKLVEGRGIVVKEIDDIGRTSCHILFVNASERRRFKARVAALSGTGVLTVGETEWFGVEGGAIAFRLEGSRLVLRINVAAAERQGVQISSKLLSIAEIVRHP